MAMATEQLTEAHPQRDGALEADMDKLGITWSFEPAMAVGRVDKERSLANQARLEPLNLATVEQYAEDMAAGDVFPAIVVEVQRTSREERLVAIGGNHRLAAARIAKRKHLAAYLVEGDPVALYRLMWSDNRRHGLPPGNGEKLLAAVHLINQGDTMAQAARTVGISYAKLVQHMAATEFDRRVGASKKLRVAVKLGDTAKQRLGSLSDVVFGPAVEAVLRHGLGQADVGELVTMLRSAGDDGLALQLLGKAEPDLAIKGLGNAAAERRRGHQSPRRAMLDALRSIRHLSAARVIADCPDDDARLVLASTIRDAASVLQQVLREVGK